MGVMDTVLTYMVDNTKTVYVDDDFEKLSTVREPGCTEAKVSKEVYDALTLVEEEYQKLTNKGK